MKSCPAPLPSTMETTMDSDHGEPWTEHYVDGCYGKPVGVPAPCPPVRRYPALRIPGILLGDLLRMFWWEVLPLVVLTPTIVGFLWWFNILFWFGFEHHEPGRTVYHRVVSRWWSSVMERARGEQRDVVKEKPSC